MASYPQYEQPSSRTPPYHTTHPTLFVAWRGVETLPADAILGLVAAFKDDAAPVKVNVAQGAYRTDEGKPFVLTSIVEVRFVLMETCRVPVRSL